VPIGAGGGRADEGREGRGLRGAARAGSVAACAEEREVGGSCGRHVARESKRMDMRNL
jgi:hypothetical protein